MKKLLFVLVTVFTLCLFTTAAYAADYEAYTFWDEESKTLTLIASDSGVPEGDYGELLSEGLPTNADDPRNWPWFDVGCYVETFTIDSSMAEYTALESTSYMFFPFNNLAEFDLSNLNTENVTDMSHMFDGCYMTAVDVSKLNTSNVTDMSAMFKWCTKLGAKGDTLDFSSFDTSKVTDMSDMFFRCGSLETLDLSGFDTSAVTDISYMLCDCTCLETLDLGSMNTANVSDIEGMFAGCEALEVIYCDADWSGNSKVANQGIFTTNLKLIGGSGTAYEWGSYPVEYARVDGGSDRPGFFTAKDFDTGSVLSEGNPLVIAVVAVAAVAAVAVLVVSKKRKKA